MESNKLKLIALLFFFSFLSIKNQAQTKYWVKFKDKNGSAYSVSNPSAFLSAKSIARRANHSIAIDLTDLPVNQSYITQVNLTGALVFQTSKWMNAAIVIVTNSSQLTAINSLTCVLNTAPVARIYKSQDDKITEVNEISNKRTASVTNYNYGLSYNQNNQIGTVCMHENGYRGENILIGILDSGFDNVNNNATFDSLRNEGRILGTRDIVAGNSSVYEDHNHGAMVLSCISGNTPGQLIGTGPKAKVYLIRTEDVGSEKPIEESNWIVGAEFADSVGVDIMTTSLGYTTFDSPFTGHTYADLNGRTSPMSIASTMAVRKGVFVLNAAGNEGSGPWFKVAIPADADSICTVGSVAANGLHSGFSSVGPTADGRIKPDLSSMGEGTYVSLPAGNFVSGNGTSFATPILAGAVACLIQANPTKTNMELLLALKATATQSTTPDNNYGWGIPNMCAAHNLINGTDVGVKENKKDKNLTIYPNPAQNKINFEVSQKIEFVTLTDVLGNTIEFNFIQKELGKYEIEFSNLIANGVYFLTLKTTDGVVNSKFVKN